jgi:hypothetical protein
MLRLLTLRIVVFGIIVALAQAQEQQNETIEFSVSDAAGGNAGYDKTCWIIRSSEAESGRRKELYTVGVLAFRGADAAYNEFNRTFSDYLTVTSGQRFDPPIRFEMKPLNFIDLFVDTEAALVDFIYVNPSASSCIESEYRAHSLVSQISRRLVGSNTYDLQKLGGVITA